MFPSPTGVNYYELFMIGLPIAFFVKFPSPTGVNYYELECAVNYLSDYLPSFPSPTGVNYYELEKEIKRLKYEKKKRFRPQQGLTIMNNVSS